MPSPTRKSKSPKINFFGNDPLMMALAKGEVLWGDLMMDLEVGTTRHPMKSKSPTRKSSKPRLITPNAERNALEGFKTPNLQLRKGIYENFPVIVNEVGAGVYEIKWHVKNLADWRKERAMSWEEYQEYELFSELRLIHSLRKHADRYELMPPTNKDQIVRFKMLGAEPVFRGPKLMRLNDIKTHFPVVWHKVEGRVGETTYGLELRSDFMRKASKTEAAAVQQGLLDALRASRAWTVLPSGEKGEVCRIEMKHE